MSRLRPLLAVPLVLAARAALADPLPEAGYGLPRDVSANGHEVDELLRFTLVSATAVFLVALAALVWAVVRHRGVRPAQFSHGTRRSIGLVLGVVALVLLAVDGSLFITTVVDLRRNLWNFAGAEATPGALRIEITAHQWAWAVRYPGPDGAFNSPGDVVTLNDLRVPIGVPVVIQLASNDVIHSL